MSVFIKNLHVSSFLGIFFLLSVALPCGAGNILAGKVVYVSDKLFAASPEHSERSIKRGASFSQGDVLKASELSRVQLRFRDATVMVLRPETEFRIDEFSYTEAIDAQQQNEASILRGSLFRGSLLKGSLRTITGDIAKKSPDAYFLNTPVATIIQAQDANFELVLGNAGLAVAVWEGSLTIENEAGSIALGGGSDFSYALITDSTIQPQGLSNPPDLAVLSKTELNQTELNETGLNKEERIKEETGIVKQVVP